MALAMQGDLGCCLCDGDSDTGKCAGLERTVEVGWSCLGEPVQLEVLCAAELLGQGVMRVGDDSFVCVDEGLAEREKQPVTVGDEDVVEELAEFRVFRGGLVVLD